MGKKRRKHELPKQSSSRKRRFLEKRKTNQPESLIWIPPANRVVVPASQHERRMREIGRSLMLPPDHPDYESQQDYLLRAMELDVGAKTKIEEIWKKTLLLHQTECLNGSGLVMSRTLRTFLHECFNRLVTSGPHSMSLQFNMFESFFAFRDSLVKFALRTEIDHLLSINDFFNWYESDDLLDKDPEILNAVMEEGVIYSFNMTNDSGFVVPTADCEFVIAGCSLIRHKNELSCVIVAGESPPRVPDELIALTKEELLDRCESSPFKQEAFDAAPEIPVSDRYLEEFPVAARVHLLLRFDLNDAKNRCWYLAQDNGNSYAVYTNETTGFDDLPPSEMENILKVANDEIVRYKDLLGMATSLIFLPVAFIAEQDFVSNVRFNTDISSQREEDWVFNALNNQFPVAYEVEVKAMATSCEGPQSRTIKPPEIGFENDGYWKKLSSGEIGADAEGHPIAGKTWVSINVSWVNKTLSSFLLRRTELVEIGPKSGYVYVMRCLGHADNLFKIGLTRVNTAERSRGLSRTTSSPLPFDVLAHWFVTDCYLVEKAVHERLAAFRVNPKREFFKLNISEIITTVEDIIRSS
ncbi:hypothetical protein Poly21_22390 [Allorhodopirellula heiligendammensis]|uniref:Bacteriophage T5 Orf172 DNA-binding domain-containing protein n=2 Tax=Allorhodopirellula heiligendammensis TaxID=2714739 RepID=A0A5C6BSN8_9BACT|nr:hypothetical protein Poly21_22390 [Allorhodopirellula heiligendammensis]